MSIISEYATGEEIELVYDKGTGETLQQQKDMDYLLTQDKQPDPKDITHFYKLFREIVSAVTRQEGLTWDMIVSREYPDSQNQKVWQDIITFKLKKRELAGVNQRSVDEPITVRPFKPMLVRTVPDPKYPGHEIEIYEQQYESTICVTPWTLSPEESNFRAMWLEETMFAFNYYFLANGIDEIVYRGREEDVERMLSPGQVKHFGCPMYFWVRTAKRYYKRLKTLDEVNVILKQDGALFIEYEI